jgi:Na+-driven multidrug efflux pump
MSLPDRRSFVELVKLSGPIFLVILAKIACYGAMTLRATDFGVVPLATHNIMMRIFFFYGTFGDAISQTAQTYLPATLYPQPDTKSFNKILKRLLVMAAILSVVNSQACIFILKNCGQFLVSDERIVNLMSQNTGYLGLAILLHPFILFLEGTVIASRDFRTLIMTYVATLGLHFSVLNYFCGSFPSVWRTFFVFQVIRAVSFSWNVWRRQCAIKREENERLELSTVPTAIVG